MDGRGRVAQSLRWIAARSFGRSIRQPRREPTALERRMEGWALRIAALRLPRYFGVAASVLIVCGGLVYGVVRGDHVGAVAQGLADLRDGLANAAGFRIAAIAMTGQKQVTREEILSTAGITGHTSLLFLDVEVARAKLRANPWIGEASVLKLYPDRLRIDITEREPYALWQIDGRVSVIAKDGTVLEPYVARRFAKLPMVVGKGAQTRAAEFFALLARHPRINDQVRASILIAERRWNLRLKNGMDVRLPEADPDRALEILAALDRDKSILSRDIVAVDLRIPDRVTVKLSDAVAQARLDAIAKDKKKKKGDA